MKDISHNDYKNAPQVWNIMEKKTLDCYHNTYSKTDVLLCLDAFETFPNMFLENYKLYHGDIILKRSHNSLFLYAKILYKLAGLWILPRLDNLNETRNS